MSAQSIYSTSEAWEPRYYYIMKNKTSGKLYVGQTEQSIETYLGSGPYWIRHCKNTVGTIETTVKLCGLGGLKMKRKRRAG